jgi:hypothetical protein
MALSFTTAVSRDSAASPSTTRNRSLNLGKRSSSPTVLQKKSTDSLAPTNLANVSLLSPPSECPIMSSIPSQINQCPNVHASGSAILTFQGSPLVPNDPKASPVPDHLPTPMFKDLPPLPRSGLQRWASTFMPNIRDKWKHLPSLRSFKDMHSRTETSIDSYSFDGQPLFDPDSYLCKSEHPSARVGSNSTSELSAPRSDIVSNLNDMMTSPSAMFRGFPSYSQQIVTSPLPRATENFVVMPSIDDANNGGRSVERLTSSPLLNSIGRTTTNFTIRAANRSGR